MRPTSLRRPDAAGAGGVRRRRAALPSRRTSTQRWPCARVRAARIWVESERARRRELPRPTVQESAVAAAPLDDFPTRRRPCKLGNPRRFVGASTRRCGISRSPAAELLARADQRAFSRHAAHVPCMHDAGFGRVGRAADDRAAVGEHGEAVLVDLAPQQVSRSPSRGRRRAAWRPARRATRRRRRRGEVARRSARRATRRRRRGGRRARESRAGRRRGSRRRRGRARRRSSAARSATGRRSSAGDSPRRDCR